MSRDAEKRVDIRDFKGLKSNVDAFDTNDSSDVQINITCVVPGKLTVRAGMRDVQWEN